MPIGQSNLENTIGILGVLKKKYATANMSGSGVGHENERKKVDIVSLQEPERLVYVTLKMIGSNEGE